MALIYIFAALIVLFVLIKLFSEPIHTPENPTEEDVKNFMRNGQKIHAIKCYRQMTGLGLKESKEAVENMEL